MRRVMAVPVIVVVMIVVTMRVIIMGMIIVRMRRMGVRIVMAVLLARSEEGHEHETP